MQTWQVGDVRISRIEELMGPLFDPTTFFPDYDAEVMQRHHDWLYPDHLASNGNIVASMHSWLIETAHHNVLVDACIGNDKDRMPFRDWHQMQTPYLDRLAETGVTPEQIDFVLCTHLHVDHVGWNTRLQNGALVPTFPNASYLFSRVEYEYWKEERDRDGQVAFERVNNQTFDDSVLPIMDLAQLIEGEHALIDDLLLIKPTPGHTPGSISLCLSTNSQQALFTGDIFHHPIQVYQPEWNSDFCAQPEQARTTRRETLEYCVETGALMMPAHFGPSHAGRVANPNGSFSFDFVPPS